jgi:hypothetical protein
MTDRATGDTASGRAAFKAIRLEAEAGKPSGAGWAAVTTRTRPRQGHAGNSRDGDGAPLPGDGRLDFTLSLGASGTYYIHVLGKATGDVEDGSSVHVGLNGRLLTPVLGLDGFDLAIAGTAPCPVTRSPLRSPRPRASTR